jgi:hypothetical protein
MFSVLTRYSHGSVQNLTSTYDVGLLNIGHTGSIADLPGNGVPARYELEIDGDHRVLES